MAITSKSVRNSSSSSSSSNVSAVNSKETTMNLTQTQLQEMIAGAVAAALAAQPVAEPVKTPVNLDVAISASRSSRLINWMGKKTLAAAEATAPVLGKVEVLAVPATQEAVAITLGKTASVAGWFETKLTNGSKRSHEASVRNTPGIDTKSIGMQLEGMSKAQLIAMITNATK